MEGIEGIQDREAVAIHGDKVICDNEVFFEAEKGKLMVHVVAVWEGFEIATCLKEAHERACVQGDDWLLMMLV